MDTYPLVRRPLETWWTWRICWCIKHQTVQMSRVDFTSMEWWQWRQLGIWICHFLDAGSDAGAHDSRQRCICVRISVASKADSHTLTLKLPYFRDMLTNLGRNRGKSFQTSIDRLCVMSSAKFLQTMKVQQQRGVDWWCCWSKQLPRKALTPDTSPL